MKTLILATIAILTASIMSAASNVGSYMTVTFALKSQYQGSFIPKTLSNGNKQTTTSFSKYAVTNPSILDELLVQGKLGAGETTFKGWKIVAAFDSDADLIGFYAMKTGKLPVYIGDYIKLTPMPTGERIYKGKQVVTPQGDLVSYSATFMEAFNLVIDGTFYGWEYSLVGVATGSEKLMKTKAKTAITAYGSIKAKFLGCSDDTDVVDGTISFGSTVALDDISIFPTP